MNVISLQMQNIHSESISEHEDITARLEGLRREVEQGTAPETWAEIELPVGLLIADVCDALGLSKDQQNQVMGDAGVLFLKTVQNTQVSA